MQISMRIPKSRHPADSKLIVGVVETTTQTDVWRQTRMMSGFVAVERKSEHRLSFKRKDDGLRETFWQLGHRYAQSMNL